MAGHSLPTGRPEPVAVAAAVQAVLAALVTLGWLNLDDNGVAAVGTVAAALVAALVTRSARAAVTPTAAPTTADGEALVPASTVTPPAAPVPATALVAREAAPPANADFQETPS
jgi:hypothetical protein